MTSTASPSVSVAPSAAPPIAQAAPTYKSTHVSAVLTAGGVRQWIDCQGSGPVTYLIITGLHSVSSDWDEVLPTLRKQTRTCTYDRPGLGRSPARTAGPYTVDAGIHANELAALLKAAGEPGPFIPMGHSYGGLVARAFAAKQAAHVAGLFLPEGVAPGYYSEGTSWSEGGTSVDLIASSAAAEKNLNLGDKPLIVMSGTVSDQDYLNGGKNGTNGPVWEHDQREAVKLSTNSIQVIALSAHVLQQDNPKAVELATKTLRDAVVARSRLNCSANWSAVNAECRPGR
ncbi:MAG: alpha/beta hydrolase [Actinomycetes bacterium]